MSTEHNKPMLPKYSRTGKLLNKPLPEGELLVSEGPDGDPLWKKKKKINEKNNEPTTLNE